MSEYMSISKAAEYLNVAKSTLRNWEAEGLITPLRTASNQRRYTKEMLDELLQGNMKAAKPKKLLTIGYCRVSSGHQKEDLQRQKDVVSRYCEVNGYQFKIIQDVGSSLNYKKKGLTELINMICKKQCERVVVNYQDRLVRFGFEMIETICQANDVELVVINQTDNVDPNSDANCKNKLNTYHNIWQILTIYAGKCGQVRCQSTLLESCSLRSSDEESCTIPRS